MFHPCPWSRLLDRAALSADLSELAAALLLQWLHADVTTAGAGADEPPASSSPLLLLQPSAGAPGAAGAGGFAGAGSGNGVGSGDAQELIALLSAPPGSDELAWRNLSVSAAAASAAASALDSFLAFERGQASVAAAAGGSSSGGEVTERAPLLVAGGGLTAQSVAPLLLRASGPSGGGGYAAGLLWDVFAALAAAAQQQHGSEEVRGAPAPAGGDGLSLVLSALATCARPPLCTRASLMPVAASLSRGL